MMSTNANFDCVSSARAGEQLRGPRCYIARAASRRRLGTCAALVAVAAVAGCGGGSQPAPSSEEGQIRAAMKVLGQEYGGYMASHNGQPPKDEAALRSYLESRLPVLSDYNVKSVDMLLRSGRDGQPLAVITGKKVEVPERSSYPWAAYEQTGVDCKRLVGDTRGGVFEIEDQEFKQHIESGS
jgi:hypothetical protein